MTTYLQSVNCCQATRVRWVSHPPHSQWIAAKPEDQRFPHHQQLLHSYQLDILPGPINLAPGQSCRRNFLAPHPWSATWKALFHNPCVFWRLFWCFLQRIYGLLISKLRTKAPRNLPISEKTHPAARCTRFRTGNSSLSQPTWQTLWPCPGRSLWQWTQEELRKKNQKSKE